MSTATAPLKAPRKPPPWTIVIALLGKIGLRGRTLIIAAPMLWLTILFLVPFLIVARISLSEPILAQPPYTPLFTWDPSGKLSISIDLGNFLFIGEDALYFSAYLSSIKIALISTILTLLIGYPMAYTIARSGTRARNILLMLVILPFWSSFLLRVYAWIGILKPGGVINNALISLGVISDPLIMLQTDFAVYVGIVYTYLPFMVLPLYASLVKLDPAYLEASADLGGRPVTTFLFITLPLSAPGIIAGSMLVFIPVIGEFVIPTLLGGPGTLMIGRVLWDEFFLNRDWPLASAVAIVMLFVIIVPIIALRSARSEVVEEN